ncbi:hypothetical protein UFOVP1666_106 [uncultured Caudovirales phage]|uniref:Uncharacterized protein n=1 Tax=uncultured Caudovirales phage TaxID=2100421 RepID=A0A6J5P8P7_9CAUD|nr:hypothetical protein UFOVP867_61 [uncultured Caudovirales phage]CAB4170897.1 hypothetical protein UFOVP913_137 [uncultured Caudovirales phage]CAB4177139.1 hypothetical protein UFOVP993_190 [uncultured Caudovirales phage]CAB4223063.1 hypothetical protein UFOVP1666_106 [uncultured Caudovirales phage]
MSRHQEAADEWNSAMTWSDDDKMVLENMLAAPINMEDYGWHDQENEYREEHR